MAVRAQPIATKIQRVSKRSYRYTLSMALLLLSTGTGGSEWNPDIVLILVQTTM